MPVPDGLSDLAVDVSPALHLKVVAQVHELTRRHIDGNAGGPGLVEQLVQALGDPRPAYGQAGRGSSTKAGSRPPGWRDDISTLLADLRSTQPRDGVDERLIRRGATEWRAVYGLAATGDLEHDLESLPDIVWADRLPDLARDVRRWRTRARRALGFLAPVTTLPEVFCGKRVLVRAGWTWVGCGEAMLRVAVDASSDVWCGNPACHDDEAHPFCRMGSDSQGYPLNLGYEPCSCRGDMRDTMHAVSWTPAEWAAMAAAQPSSGDEARA